MSRLPQALTPRRLTAWSLAAVAIALSGCSKSPAPAMTVTPVLVMTVGAGSASTLRTLPGMVTPRYAANLGFQVPGRIQKRLVELGSRVRKGQALLTLGTDDYTQGLLASQDQVVAARAELQQSVADAKRFKMLAERGMISQAGLGAQQARADAAQAKLDQAQRQLELARNRMAYTTLTAPFDGVVTAVNAEVGQVVGEGMPVVSVARDDALEVTVEVPEDMHIDDAASDKAYAGRLTGKSAAPLRLRLREVAPASTAPLRTFRAAFSILNAKDIASELRIGLSAEVSLAHAAHNGGGMPLPAGALMSNGQEVAVWAVDTQHNTLQRQPVRVKATSNDGLLVDGLGAGQRIVIAGTDKLSSGQPVRPIERTGSGYEPGTP